VGDCWVAMIEQIESQAKHCTGCGRLAPDFYLHERWWTLELGVIDRAPFATHLLVREQRIAE
jgi:hypothetical protein